MRRRLAPAVVVVTGALNCGPNSVPPQSVAADVATSEAAPASSPTMTPTAAPTPGKKPSPPRRVVVTGSNPPAVSMVLFAALGSEPLEASHALLDEVAHVLLDHREITRLLIEGHSDPRVEAQQGKALAARRAEAVRQALIQRGVDAKRLLARGAAGMCPFAVPPNEQNQRVMFHVLEKNGETVAAGCDKAAELPDKAR